jgi:polysaccharide biosynthesis transport protein
MATDGREGSKLKSVHDLGLVEAFGALRRQLWLVIGIAAAVAVVATVLSLMKDDEYTATATVFARNSSSVVVVRAPKHYNYKTALIAPRPDAGREVVSGVEVASLDVVTDRTAKLIGGGVSGEELSDKLEVSPVLESDLLEFQATAAKPRLAAEYANAFARAYIGFRRDKDRSKVRSATRAVKRGLRGIPASRLAARDLRLRRQQLGTLNIIAALQSGNTEFVERAKPPSTPSSPQPARNAVLGVALGLLLGITVALMRGRLGGRSKSERTVPGPMIDRVASGEHR